MNMYVTLSSTCFGPWYAHLQEEQLHKHSPLSTGVVCSRLVERGYQMLCLCSCSSWRWAYQGPKHVEDNVTYMFILKCALKLVLKKVPVLGAFAKLWNANISFVIPVYPSVRLSVCLAACPHGQTQLPLDGFSRILYWRVSQKYVVKIKFDLNLTRITGILHEYLRKFTVTSRAILFRMRNISNTVLEKI